ncbi:MULTISPECIES: cytochrome d ubiquinol oxidase subunit II [unclassified Paenibacillus]|uniref:cytochrome d ubiquinol oxidase subunit II n=1 Tax=unclassified Paenibacillus TaxID=185978 RepID=UPI0003E246C7|nr:MULTISPECIES: cytochrome d ubiquinol oxidase subunit II [unclassified Paenibacillus]ETT39590.1 cytochrome d ubiquinol oxidase subunit II [Paenibacillus sp. FSL R7-269]OMF87651.1 cytochrome d ubiquinol oxidase subunit II [Paenibacillus sp. FSL R7-0337]
MSLNELWFLLIAVLFVGFFFLEGFDFGVGMETQILAKNDTERRILINSIGPFWDANEVWLITGAGAMFAAFPHWYATLFSGFYIPFVVALLALIARGVAFEFRGKRDSKTWQKTWDVCIFFGSFLPPFLLAVVFASFIKGLPIDKDMQMYAGFFDIVNTYTVVAGITVVLLCLVHGLMFTTLRTLGDLQERARKLAQKLLIPLAALLVAFVVMTYTMTDIFDKRGTLLWIVVVLGVAAYLLAGYFMTKKKDGYAFGMTGAVMALSVASIFIGLFPRVMISSLDQAFNLTITNAASGQYSLKVMTIVALTLLPFVLGYQIWSYFIFHKRVHEKEHLEY